jgi:hypothetical protein
VTPAGKRTVRALQFICIVSAIAVAYPFSEREPPPLSQEKAITDAPEKDQATLEGNQFSDHLPDRVPETPITYRSLGRDPSFVGQETATTDVSKSKEAKLEESDLSSEGRPLDQVPPKPNLSYLAYYVYSEVPPDIKPAATVLDTYKDVVVGAPLEEIKRASDIFGLDVSFMRAVAKIESDFDPNQRTGSYIGLFQLSNYEFDKYGSGNIIGVRDNAVAAAYKFITAAVLFEWHTHKKPTLSDLYLIHQQGTQGAAEHVSHPERIAWKSMCATDEGREKGEKWCKRAVWQNTLPAIKDIWKSVDKLTSGAFVTMWQQRVDQFYSHYSEAASAK